MPRTRHHISVYIAILHLAQHSHHLPSDIVMSSQTEIVFPSSNTLVESVTIFSSPNKIFAGSAVRNARTRGVAEVVRSLSLGLKAGPNKVVITGLSSSIDKRSVRVSVKGGPATRLFDLVCTVDSSSPNSNSSGSSEDVLANLHAKREVLGKMKDIYKHESFVLFEYGRSLTSQNRVGSEQVASFLQTFSEQARHSVEEEAKIDKEILLLDNQIQEHERTLKAQVGDAKGQVRLVLVAENDGQIEIKLTYVVSGASWNSVYELHAKNINDKPSSSVILNYNAQVTQGTGEDWTDTVIKLSTSSNDLSIPRTIPQLHGVKVQLDKVAPAVQVYAKSMPLQPIMRRAAAPISSYSSLPEGDGMGFGLFDEEVEPRSIEVQPPQPPSKLRLPDSSVIVTKSSASLVYAVKGLISIPSDGLPHQVPVARLPFEAKISHVSVPWVEPDVYLRCSIKNTSDYKIFSGPVNILFDDTLVSISSLQEVDIGDEFECSLGTDPDVHITYSRKHSPPRTEGGGFSETYNSTEVLAKVSIRNKHAFKIEELYVQDGIPVPSDKACKVLLQKPEGLAEADGDCQVEVKEGVSVRWKGGALGKADGLLEWLSSIDAGGSLDLEVSWVVRTPDHALWTEVKA